MATEGTSDERRADTPFEPLRQSAAYGWWYPTESLLEAADDFDHDFTRIRSRARQCLAQLRTDTTSLSTRKRFDVTVAALRGSRYRVQPLRFAGEGHRA